MVKKFLTEGKRKVPLAKGKSKKAVKARFKELYADNKKSGKARGDKGKPRSRNQIIAIALNATGKKKKTIKRKKRK